MSDTYEAIAARLAEGDRGAIDAVLAVVAAARAHVAWDWSHLVDDYSGGSADVAMGVAEIEAALWPTRSAVSPPLRSAAASWPRSGPIQSPCDQADPCSFCRARVWVLQRQGIAAEVARRQVREQRDCELSMARASRPAEQPEPAATPMACEHVLGWGVLPAPGEREYAGPDDRSTIVRVVLKEGGK